MSGQQIKPSKAQIRATLLHIRDELSAANAQANASAETVELDQSRVGRLSRMDALQSQQMAIATNQRRQLRVLQVEQALRRLDADEYGFCDECGEDIDPRRLAIDPLLTRCIRCAE